MAEGSVSGLRVLVLACEAFNVYLSDGKPLKVGQVVLNNIAM